MVLQYLIGFYIGSYLMKLKIAVPITATAVLVTLAVGGYIEWY